MNLIEKFKKEQLSEAQANENKAAKWRADFIAEYPRNAIISMSMDNYLISRSKVGNPNAFCRRICSMMESDFHIQTKSKLPFIFGISRKIDAQLKLSTAIESKFGNDYDKAFIYIKNEISNLLDAADKNNYSGIESCELCGYFKYVLLTIYFPDKFVSVCNSALMEHYCKRIGIPFNPNEEMIYTNNALIEWKNAVPEIADWSNFILTCFCDWLYKKDMTIDCNHFRMESDTISTQVTQEIEELNIQGESKEAFVKIRVNQGVFRDRLIQHYNECCLCGMNNQSLLVASHIKPWSVSEPNEKLDSDNGFLMCPNHDKLFDQGWISFNDNGSIIISSRLSLENRILLNIKDNMKISLTEKNKKYLHYHRKNIFKNT